MLYITKNERKSSLMLSVILTSLCHTTVIVFYFKVVFLCLLKKYLQLSECYN